jgi:geranylgeranyl pyrophosphate synthase
MSLKDVFYPVRADIAAVERELRSLASTLSFEKVKVLLDRFFSSPGKYLRPALLLMSAKAIGGELSSETQSRLIRAAAGVELIHNASLVHDDVIDEDSERRGQPTINHSHSNRIAILAGDTLYSKAFGLLVEALPKALLMDVVALNVKMCSAEIEQEAARKKPKTKELFLRINEGKTASFMSLCCKLGSSLAGGTDADVRRLESFGLNYGMAYQLFDDFADKDADCPGMDFPAEGRAFSDKALLDIAGLPDSVGKGALRNLIDHLVAVSCA